MKPICWTLLCGILCASAMGGGCREDRQAQVKILLRSDRDGNEELYLMNLDGTGLTNLTNDLADNSQAAVTPDGTQVVFTSMPANQHVSSLMKVNLDGTGKVVLVSDWNYNYYPMITRDGSRVVELVQLVEVQ
jgi:TolB protein